MYVFCLFFFFFLFSLLLMYFVYDIIINKYSVICTFHVSKPFHKQTSTNVQFSTLHTNQIKVSELDPLVE